VHFFWGSFDLAVTRFSGRRAPRHPGGVPHLPDAVAHEAYSHEVSSAGFWPGSGAIDYPAFYSYAYPEPPGFRAAKVRPDAAFFSEALGEFILPYDAVRTSASPGATLMAFSNTEGAMLLSTGNKSELAVGYCTLYGDMCGGLAVISDVPKTLVYDLARYVNREREVIPRSSLSKAPSAELRPNQTDQDTLPPYDVIDRVIEGYIERDLDLASIVATGIDRAVAQDIIGRIDRNEYKRRQAAPGLKITSKAFGVGRRYPIAARYDAALPTAPEAATSAPRA